MERELGERVEAYLDGALSSEETYDFERDLATSPELSRAFAAALLIREMLGSIPPARAPAGLEDKIARLLGVDGAVANTATHARETAVAPASVVKDPARMEAGPRILPQPAMPLASRDREGSTGTTQRRSHDSVAAQGTLPARAANSVRVSAPARPAGFGRRLFPRFRAAVGAATLGVRGQAIALEGSLEGGRSAAAGIAQMRWALGPLASHRGDASERDSANRRKPLWRQALALAWR